MAATFRRRVFEALDTDPRTERRSAWVAPALIALIALNVLAVMLESVDALHEAYRPYFQAFEWVSLGVFTIEYVLRVWTAPEEAAFSGALLGRVRYVATPFALIDLAAILPSLLLVASVGGVDLRFLRVLRFFRLFRLLKLGRYSPAVQTFADVFRERKADLGVAIGIAGVLLVLSSSMMYLAEHDAQPDKFPNIFASMWWAIITLMTVGYGDVYPITTLGRVIGGATAMLGVGLVALPAAILASGFLDAMAKRRAATAAPPCPHCGKRADERVTTRVDVQGPATVQAPPQR